MRSAVRVGHRFAQELLFGVEQAQLHPRQRLAGGHREKMERDAVLLPLPDRADIG
jgi:hypothetical protein